MANGMMILLSLPMGLLWLLLLSAMGYILSLYGVEIGGGSIILNFIIWLGFLIIGYVQWFKLIPVLIQKIRHRKKEQQ